MSFSAETHPFICLLIPCVGIAKVRPRIYVLQVGLLFWTCALEVRFRKFNP